MSWRVRAAKMSRQASKVSSSRRRIVSVNVSGTTEAHREEVLNQSATLRIEEHLDDCPVRHGASAECCWPIAVCVPAVWRRDPGVLAPSEARRFEEDAALERFWLEEDAPAR